MSDSRGGQGEDRKNDEKTRDPATVAITPAEAEAYYEEGMRLVEAKENIRAEAKLKPAADQGYAPAQYQLGLIYSQTVLLNYIEAIKYFEKAAKQNYSPDAKDEKASAAAKLTEVKRFLQHLLDLDLYSAAPLSDEVKKIQLSGVYSYYKHLYDVEPIPKSAETTYALGKMTLNASRALSKENERKETVEEGIELLVRATTRTSSLDSQGLQNAAYVLIEIYSRMNRIPEAAYYKRLIRGGAHLEYDESKITEEDKIVIRYHANMTTLANWIKFRANYDEKKLEAEGRHPLPPILNEFKDELEKHPNVVIRLLAADAVDSHDEIRNAADKMISTNLSRCYAALLKSTDTEAKSTVAIILVDYIFGSLKQTNKILNNAVLAISFIVNDSNMSRHLKIIFGSQLVDLFRVASPVLNFIMLSDALPDYPQWYKRALQWQREALLPDWKVEEKYENQGELFVKQLFPDRDAEFKTLLGDAKNKFDQIIADCDAKSENLRDIQWPLFSQAIKDEEKLLKLNFNDEHKLLKLKLEFEMAKPGIDQLIKIDEIKAVLQDEKMKPARETLDRVKKNLQIKLATKELKEPGWSDFCNAIKKFTPAVGSPEEKILDALIQFNIEYQKAADFNQKEKLAHRLWEFLEEEAKRMQAQKREMSLKDRIRLFALVDNLDWVRGMQKALVNIIHEIHRIKSQHSPGR